MHKHVEKYAFSNLHNVSHLVSLKNLFKYWHMATMHSSSARKKISPSTTE